MSKTLFDKVWDSHVVESIKDGPDIFLIDKHFIHEVTSPQAFDELKRRNLKVFDPNKIIATVDHNVPTLNQHLPINDKLSRNQVEKLKFNCLENNIDLFGLGNPNQGIVHVIGPELGITQPGMTIVCGDSHTSTHGAFGAIAFGIGTSQVAQVLASQCLLLNKPKKMRISINGKLNKNVTPKDIILYIISKLGTNGGTGFFVEYSGDVFKKMSMEGRMTVCNMSIEMGARGGIIAPDEITYKYLKNRDYSPKGKKLNSKIEGWNKLKTEKNAKFDKEHLFNASEIYPMLTYGTNPAMGIKYNDKIPDHNNKSDLKSLSYMGFKSGERLIGKKINYVFIGSCTNSRIEDFRLVAKYIKNKRKADNVNALIVPGSQKVLNQIKEEGLENIFSDSGFEIRQPGCSACLGMNDDKIPAGELCVSTSNRNFEGRQGPGSRTILSSPIIAAATAIHGKIVDINNE